MQSRMERTNKQRTFVATSVITVNAIASVLLAIAMVYMFMQVLYQQHEISDLRNKLQEAEGKHEDTQQTSKPRHYHQNFESAHIVGSGNRVRSAPAPGDVYRITSWKRKYISGNMTYDNNGHLTVNIDGVYFVYGQMFYIHRNNSYTGFSVFIDNKKVLKAIYSIISEHKPYHTQYISGIFKITKGQRIWVGTSITREYFFNEFSSFFGAYMLHPLR